MALATSRLVLRALVADDDAELWRLLTANREHLARFMPRLAHRAHTLGSTRRLIVRLARRIAGGAQQLGIFAGGALIGAIGLEPRDTPARAELGYWIGEAHEGRGYVREAARAVLDAATWATVVELQTDAENLRSQAVARALGFRAVEGTDRWELRRSFTIPHGLPWVPPASSSSPSVGMTESPSPAMSAS